MSTSTPAVKIISRRMFKPTQLAFSVAYALGRPLPVLIGAELRVKGRTFYRLDRMRVG